MSNSIQGVYQGSFMPLNEIRVSPLSRAYTFSDSIYEVQDQPIMSMYNKDKDKAFLVA